MLARTETSSGHERTGHRPVRSCVACRQQADTRDLLRVVRAPDGGLVFDWRRNLGGRGAYVCPTRGCVENAIKCRSFDRTLKASARYPEPQELIETAREALDRQIETLVGSAVSSAYLGAGTDATLRALGDGKAACLLVAGDAATRNRFVAAAATANVACYVTSTKNRLGALAGRGETGVLSINSHGLAAAIGQAITRREALGDENSRNE
ncbi:MAG: DUF448 domain-containing protein [Deltaproteobacteria bacterium]|nr:DUF448 domain-containing protein [Deltaproteobacteria bacterium]